MRSLFMYILQSDNCSALLCSICASNCLILLRALCLHLASSCLDLLVLHITPSCVTLILGDHTTHSSHILRRSHYWSLNPRLQVHWPCWFSDHTGIDTEKIIRSPLTGIRLPLHARTNEFNYTSMVSFLVQVKILSLVDSAGWW